MRTLALILILLNVGYLYWQSQSDVAAPQVVSHSTPPQGVATLILLGERQDGPAPRPVPAQAASSAAPTWQCETVGPFNVGAQAESLQALLVDTGLTGTVRSVSREVVASYWVFMPPRATRDAALTLAWDLTARGLRDLYIINDGEHRNGIALGLFSEHDRARRRVEELDALGYGAGIEARNRTQTHYWLDLSGPADSFSEIPIPPGVNRMERPCPPLVEP
ncbi:MAG: SPOR domain-containing protein [Thioalkalivibrio sp.]